MSFLLRYPIARRALLRGAGVCCLALGWMLAGSLPARAGTLDLGLLKNSGDVLEYVKEKGWKNVGVLPFQVQRGARPLSYAGGPLSHNMTTRIENALIMAMDANETKAVGIIRDAAGTANKAGVGSFHKDERAYRKLFATSYDLAWGNRKVKADAFLTGKILNTGDRKQTRVVILALDATSRQGGKMIAHTVKEFSVETDRMLAADLGYNFSLNRAVVLSRGVKPLKRNQEATQEIFLEEENGQQLPPRQGQGSGQGQPTGGQGLGQGMEHSPANIAGFSFELHYNGMNQPLTPTVGSQQGSRAAEFQAPPATAGSSIAMYLTRLSNEQRKFGVVLMLNGKSTWQMQDMEPIQCQKWVYDASRTGQRDGFEGFYTDTTGNNLLRFRALTAEESLVKASELGSRAGWIDVYVFASGDGKGSGDEEQMLISTRGSVRSRSLGLDQLQSQLRQKNHVRIKPSLVKKRSIGGLIVHEMEPVPSTDIDTGDMPNPVLVGHMAIRYYEGVGQQGTGQPGGGQQGTSQPFNQPLNQPLNQPQGGSQPIQP